MSPHQFNKEIIFFTTIIKFIALFLNWWGYKPKHLARNPTYEQADEEKHFQVL
jgi:hypothetical protein